MLVDISKTFEQIKLDITKSMLTIPEDYKDKIRVKIYGNLKDPRKKVMASEYALK